MSQAASLDPFSFLDAFEKSFREQRAEVSIGFRERLGLLWSARVAVASCIANAHRREDREFPKNEAKSKIARAAIHVAITQGIELVETAIASACYAQASALVRQEMEAVESLRGIRLGKQKDKTTPRLVALRHLGKPYGQLSGLAHLSAQEDLINITDVLGSGLDHKVQVEFETFLFCIHLVALVGLAIDISELRPASNEARMLREEEELIQAVCGILSERGYLSVQ